MPNMSENGGTQIAPEAPKYKYDRVRLKTFQSWPANAKVEAWKMARAGSATRARARRCSAAGAGSCSGTGSSRDQQHAEHVAAA